MTPACRTSSPSGPPPIREKRISGQSQRKRVIHEKCFYKLLSRKLNESPILRHKTFRAFRLTLTTSFSKIDLLQKDLIFMATHHQGPTTCRHVDTSFRPRHPCRHFNIVYSTRHTDPTCFIFFLFFLLFFFLFFYFFFIFIFFYFIFYFFLFFVMEKKGMIVSE